MDTSLPEAAQKIVADYASVLESQTQHDIYPALLTDLPYPRWPDPPTRLLSTLFAMRP